MALPIYSPERRREVAIALGIDEQYLYQVLKGLRIARPGLARRIHAIDGAARLQDLRPDDWHEIWPDLSAQSCSGTETRVVQGA
jgi:DNA-binding transcriptional regulator YdaS (Cro superfamily)